MFEATGAKVLAEQHEELDGLLGFRLFHEVPEPADTTPGRGGMGRFFSSPGQAAEEVGQDVLLIHLFCHR